MLACLLLFWAGFFFLYKQITARRCWPPPASLHAASAIVSARERPKDAAQALICCCLSSLRLWRRSLTLLLLQPTHSGSTASCTARSETHSKHEPKKKKDRRSELWGPACGEGCRGPVGAAVLDTLYNPSRPAAAALLLLLFRLLQPALHRRLTGPPPRPNTRTGSHHHQQQHQPTNHDEAPLRPPRVRPRRGGRVCAPDAQGRRDPGQGKVRESESHVLC
jgi:hypothetical protein